jgi:drug/metabolite transporter (DMT)-like permease
VASFLMAEATSGRVSVLRGEAHFLAAAALFLLLVGPSLRRITRREVVGGTAAGAVLFAAYAFQTAGLGYTTASNAGFITGLAVVLTPLLGTLVLRIRSNRRQLLGALLATTGLAAICLRGLEIHLGDALVLGCAVCFAAHILVLSRVAADCHPGWLTLVQLFTVGMLALAWTIAADEVVVPSGQNAWLALGITAVIASALAFFVQTRAQQNSSPNRIALILTLEPVFGGIFGYWLAHDPISVAYLVGAILIIAGILTAELKD